MRPIETTKGSFIEIFSFHVSKYPYDGFPFLSLYRVYYIFFEMASTVSDNVAERSSNTMLEISDKVEQMDIAGGSEDVKEVRNHSF